MEFLWWKCYNRAARGFILALFFCAGNPETADFPGFESAIKRFNEQEKQERSEELAFVLQYQDALAKRIADILKKRVPERYKKDFEEYFDEGTFWFLHPLPSWCRKAKIKENGTTEFQDETSLQPVDAKQADER